MSLVPNKAIALYMGLIFLSGAVVGVLGDRVYSARQEVTVTETPARKGNRGKRRPTPEEFRSSYLNFMQQRLKMSEHQLTNLELILDETKTSMDQLIMSTVPEQMALRVDQDKKIRDLLDESQRAEYDKMLHERDEMMRKGKRGDGSGTR